ncbi:MAG: transcription termination factor NusA [Anaerolineaceae bacterium]|nr:transcription termination factor NusA [Anaerolineaceae bacterium]
MKTEFALAFNEVLEEKQLPKDIIQAAIEDAMVSAYRKSVNASTAQDVQVTLDMETGDVKVFAEKEVTDIITDSRTEVLLEEALKIDPEAQMGDLLMVESTPENFGRVAAQNARQMIQQRIRDAEKNAQLEFYGRQVNEIVSGVVQAVNARGATIGLDLKAEGMMQRKDMIPGERLKIRERIRALIYDVQNTPRGPQILMSRGHRNFLRRLLEIEVPEIYHGVVEIRSIAREPGQRAKVAVSTNQTGIDPVGACVGRSGVRIQTIVRELHDEKIDVIEWNKDAAVYIAKAISPARVTGVYLNSETEGNKTATVVVPEDQLSLAIGREGQNARLAAKLTGWRIDIMSLVEAAGRALVKLRTNPDYVEMLENEADNPARIEELLLKKSEGRAISPEDYTLMARFVDRIERRGEADRKADDEAAQARLSEIRETIPVHAFDLPILDSELKEHVSNILQEGGIETLGDLILQVKDDADKILSFNGIGPKTFEEIKSFVDEVKIPEIVQVEEETLGEGEVSKVDVTEVAEGIEGTDVVVETVQPELPQADQAETPVVDETQEQVETSDETVAVEDVPFEELFKVDPVKFDYVPDDEISEEDGSDPDGNKKKKGKKKKGYTVVFDPDKGEATVKRSHKRDETWEDW